MSTFYRYRLSVLRPQSSVPTPCLVSLHLSHFSKAPAPQHISFRCPVPTSPHPSHPDRHRYSASTSTDLRQCYRPRRPRRPPLLPPSALERTFALSLGISSPSRSPRRSGRLRARVARLSTLPSPGGLERRVNSRSAEGRTLAGGVPVPSAPGERPTVPA